MVNLIDTKSPFNKLGIPVSVSREGLISQVLAFGISVFTQNDLVTGLVLLYQDVKESVRATRRRDRRWWPVWTVVVCCLLLVLGTDCLDWR